MASAGPAMVTWDPARKRPPPCVNFDHLAVLGCVERELVRKILAIQTRALMDLRLILVVAPILLAASWAVFHIGRAAVGQLQLFIKRAA